MNRLHRVAAAGAMTALGTLAFAGHASAHNSGASATCNGITTSLQFFENAAGDRVYTSIDGTLVDTFNGPFVTTTHTVPVPQDGVAHTWTVVVDSVSGTGGTQYDATYNGNVGPCGEVQTTTTVAQTTTTTEATTSTTSTTVIAGTTTTIPATSTTTTTATTTLPDTTTTEASTSTTVPADTSTTLPSTTSSSVVTSSTPSTSTSTTSSVPATSTTVPPSSVVSSTSSTVPECSDNPNTPTDECAPICTPVTQSDGTNSCGPSLPATGTDVLWLLPAAIFMTLCGAVIIVSNRRQ